VKTLPDILHRAGGDGKPYGIYLLRGVVKGFVRCVCRWWWPWDESPSRALLPTSLASVDVIPFLEASLGHFCYRFATLAGVAPRCDVSVCASAYLRFGLSSLVIGVAAAVWFFAADTLSLALGRILCRRCRFGLPPHADVAECVLDRPPLVDILPRCLGRMLCRCSC